MASADKPKKNMIPEGLLTVERGVQTKTIDFQGVPVEVTLKVMTNAEANALAEEFTEIVGGDFEMDLPLLSEARILRGLLDINTTFGGKEWKELSTPEKREALQVLHPELREKIGNEIFGKSHLTREERDFLRKASSQEE